MLFVVAWPLLLFQLQQRKEGLSFCWGPTLSYLKRKGCVCQVLPQSWAWLVETGLPHRLCGPV